MVQVHHPVQINKPNIKMGNKISCDLPALLENQLQDMAQMYQDIDYTDIIKFSKRPEKDIDKAYALIIKLDKAGFFESDISDEPTEYAYYNELINLVKNK